MPLHEQLEYRLTTRNVIVNVQQRNIDKNPICNATPLGVGDQSCAMATRFLRDVAANVQTFHSQFIKQYGDLIGATAELAKISDVCCDQEFAWRECGLNLAKEAKDKIKQTKALLAATSKLGFVGEGGALGLPIVSFMSTAAASSSAAPPPPRTYVCAACLHGPIEVIFLPCLGGCGEVVVGDDLVISTSLGDVATEADLAMDLCSSDFGPDGSWKALQVMYRCNTPLNLVVTETKDVTAELRTTCSSATHNDVKQLFREKRKKINNKSNGDPSRPNQGARLGDDDMDEDSSDVDMDRDDPGVPDNVDEYWKVKAEWHDAVAFVHPIADDELPRVDQKTDAVQWLHCAISGRKLATVSTFTKGSYTSFSVYCNLHGCKDVVHISRAPSLQNIRIWAKGGLENPGRVVGKPDHLKALRLLTRGSGG